MSAWHDRVGDLTLFEALTGGAFDRQNGNTAGNLTQNETRPVGHLTFVSKRLSAVGSKRISQFFDSAREPRSRVIALFDSTWFFLLLLFYIVLKYRWDPARAPIG